jgi:hypothetical protein
MLYNSRVASGLASSTAPNSSLASHHNNGNRPSSNFAAAPSRGHLSFLYLAVHTAHAVAPGIWTVSHCTRILTAIMSAKPFAWRVVGVTPAALKKLSELDFRYQSKCGLTRAHLRPRIETVRELLGRAEPLPQIEFIEFWFTHDRTVLCAAGENRAIVPQFVELQRPRPKSITTK